MDDADTAAGTDPSDQPAATPLPRRSRQQHMEPQLRERGGSGDGTPFAAFAEPDPDATGGPRTTGASAAAFQRGTGRAPAEG